MQVHELVTDLTRPKWALGTDTEVKFIVYNSYDEGMTVVEGRRPQYDELEFLFVEKTVEGHLQMVFQLKEPKA